MGNLTLLSTVVAPHFGSGTLRLIAVPTAELPQLLEGVTRNLCGHPVTDALLRAACPVLPPQERAFWDGSTTGLAVRPRGGVRGAQAAGDTAVAGLQLLEAVLVLWEEAVNA